MLPLLHQTYTSQASHLEFLQIANAIFTISRCIERVWIKEFYNLLTMATNKFLSHVQEKASDAQLVAELLVDALLTRLLLRQEGC